MPDRRYNYITKQESSHAITPHRLLDRLLLFLIAATFSSAVENPEQHYCGKTWPDAFDNCYRPCPTQSDSECSSLGNGVDDADWKCFGFTGCVDKLNEGGATDDDAGGDDAGIEQVEEGTVETISGVGDSDFYCGTSWTDAMVNCNVVCPSGDDTECPSGQVCFAAANCAVPLITVTSQMVVSMVGPDTTMDNADQSVFGSTLDDFISDTAGGEGLSLNGVQLGQQSLSSRRLIANVTSFNHRRLPTGSSALDVSVTVTGEYRPPPYIDFDLICSDSINRDSDMVVSTLQMRGQQQGREFFQRVQGIEALNSQDFTKRPTAAPTKDPTPLPTSSPTSKPSDYPSTEPSDVPSVQPSRALIQSIDTGSEELLSVGGDTTSSFGYMFNIRTKPGSSAVIITGMEFFTKATNKMKFELWSRPGSFKDFKGSLDGWEEIGKGGITGNGPGIYTSIPSDSFIPVDIPGGGGKAGTRAFYLTLKSKDLVYSVGEGTESDVNIQSETPEIELWEGEGVLLYPMPDATQTMYYRYPRQFLGQIFYDRLPCRPYSLYGLIQELPCPEVPTQSPTEPQPTHSPLTPAPTLTPSSEILVRSSSPTLSIFEGSMAPTIHDTPAPTVASNKPTFAPSSSKMPSSAPSSRYPTYSPIVPLQANIMITLNNVPERIMNEREIEVFTQATLEFLQKYTEQTLIINYIDIWHQEVILVNQATKNMTNEDSDSNAEDNNGILDGDFHTEGTNELNNSLSDFETEDKNDSAGSFADLSQRKRELKAGGSSSTGSSGPVLEQEKLDKIIAFKQKHMDKGTKVGGVQVTLILRIPFAYIPENLLGKFASVTVQEHGIELLLSLTRQSSFYSYFKELDGISALSIEVLTHPPTNQPTSYAQLISLQSEDQIPDEDSFGQNFETTVALVFILFWLFLTAISVGCLFKARMEMNEQKKMVELLSQERSSAKPLIKNREMENSYQSSLNTHSSSDEEQAVTYSIAPTRSTKLSKEDTKSPSTKTKQQTKAAVYNDNNNDAESMSLLRPSTKTQIPVSNEETLALSKAKTKSQQHLETNDPKSSSAQTSSRSKGKTLTKGKSKSTSSCESETNFQTTENLIDMSEEPISKEVESRPKHKTSTSDAKRPSTSKGKSSSSLSQTPETSHEGPKSTDASSKLKRKTSTSDAKRPSTSKGKSSSSLSQTPETRHEGPKSTDASSKPKRKTSTSDTKRPSTSKDKSSSTKLRHTTPDKSMLDSLSSFDIV